MTKHQCNRACALCREGRNCICGRFCTRLRLYVEQLDAPPCAGKDAGKPIHPHGRTRPPLRQDAASLSAGRGLPKATP